MKVSGNVPVLSNQFRPLLLNRFLDDRGMLFEKYLLSFSVLGKHVVKGYREDTSVPWEHVIFELI